MATPEPHGLAADSDATLSQPVIGSLLDHLLTRFSAWQDGPPTDGQLPTRMIEKPVGRVRVFDSGSAMPCILLTPDGPNVIEHYETLIRLLAPKWRVVCFDFPGFGHSLPSPRYTHSLDDGAEAVLAVLDALGIRQATLAFSCANGFYALRTAQVAPQRITRIVLSQTPSMTAMHAWKRRVIPWPVSLPVIGQAGFWLVRRGSAHGWYDSALPQYTPRQPFRSIAGRAFDHGACWCLAGITQGLARENVHALRGTRTPCTLIWGPKDRSHRHTDPESLREIVPHAEVIRFADCGHFPDLEQPERFAELLAALPKSLVDAPRHE